MRLKPHSNKFKALRDVARNLTVGMPDRRLMIKELRLHGQVVGRIIVNDLKTTRGVYRRLKKTEDARVIQAAARTAG